MRALGLWIFCTLVLGTAAFARTSPGDLPSLYAAAESAKGPREQAAAEVKLGEALLEVGFPVSAGTEFASALQAGPRDGSYVSALQGLLDSQEKLEDEHLIPSVLAGASGEMIARLAPDAFARANYLAGEILQRKGELEQARIRLSAVPERSVLYAKARYLLGIVLGDPRYPGGPRADEAIADFRLVLDLRGTHQEALPKTQQLAQLGLARTFYGVGRFAESVKAYEAVPRFSRYWDQALFENGFARFRNDDLGGALGSLQALHAPQFEGAFLPESWILKGTIYFFSCLYQESLSALTAFDHVYAPMIAQLRPIAGDKDADPMKFYEWVSDEHSTLIPRPVLLWVRNNERLLGVFRLIRQVDAERAKVASSPELQGTPAQSGLTAILDRNRATTRQVAGQLAKNRLIEAYRSLKNFSDQAEIIKFETTKAEKELVEAGVDQQKVLLSQKLLRPGKPGDEWEYFKFDGEFWTDEIGYYQYTLKNGCPARGQPTSKGALTR